MPDARFVGIGVSEYEDDGYPMLGNAVADVEAVASFLGPSFERTLLAGDPHRGTRAQAVRNAGHDHHRRTGTRRLHHRRQGHRRSVPFAPVSSDILIWVPRY
jgi:hypothetical protein